jgi:hypothetical protein
LQKALSRDPEARFQNADEFSEELEKMAKEVGGLASLRDVGKVVEKFASERITADKQRIKEAIQTFGSAEHVMATRPPGADDLISEPSGGAWTGSSASPVSRSGPSGANSAISKMSGVYPHGTSPSALGARAPLRPPPPPPRRSAATGEEVVQLTDADMEQSELSVMSLSQVGAAPGSHIKMLAVLALCCLVLVGAVLWAVLREPGSSEVRVIQFETEAAPAPAPPAPVAPQKVDQAEAEQAEPQETEEEAVAEPTKAGPKPAKPRRWRKWAVRKKPEPGKPAAAAPEPSKPDPMFPEGTLRSPAVAEPAERPPPPPPPKKPSVIDELDPNNPYR